MCGRYVSARTVDLIAEELGVADVDEVLRADHRPDYNVAPTATVPAVLGRTLTAATWGLPVQVGDGTRLVINARVESAAERPAFSSAYAERRCLLPADGYYEWSGSGAARQPWFLSPADGGLLVMAGLYFRRGDGLLVVVLTGPATGEAARLHDRTPMAVPPEGRERWLTAAGAPVDTLVPATALGLDVCPVSPAVNSVANNGPYLLDRQPVQSPLF
ncbi:MAG TPA: SOS response-associated peptidase [Mycobacteriales bacterium]|nr:SOS response-associated peptidase [Mycobacteriales bacterium]